MPAVCRNAADLRQLAAAYLLSIDTGRPGARGTQITVVHDDGRTVVLLPRRSAAPPQAGTGWTPPMFPPISPPTSVIRSYRPAA